MPLMHSHPWLSFVLDWSVVPKEIWYLVGRCRGLEHFFATLILPQEAGRVLRRNRFAKTVASIAGIQGNTLPEMDVAMFLEGDLSLDPTRRYLGVEVQNIADALSHRALRPPPGEDLLLSLEWVIDTNDKVIRKLSFTEDRASKFREIDFSVNASQGAPQAEIPALLKQLVEWLKKDFIPDEAFPAGIWPYMILRAFVLRLYLEWIRPFQFGNRSTAALLEMDALMSAGLPPLLAALPSVHIMNCADLYFEHVERAKQGRGIFDYLLFELEGFHEGLSNLADETTTLLGEIAWEKQVDQVIGEERNERNDRRKLLMLEISQAAGPVPKANLPLLSERVALAYSNTNGQALDDDLADLVELRLLEFRDDGYCPSQNSVRAFASLILDVD